MRDLDKAVDGVLASAFGYQGQKCSACSRAIVDATVYDEFLEKLAAKASSIHVGPATIPRNYMGPVISRERPQDHPRLTSKSAGKAAWWLEAGRVPAGGYFIPPTVIADVEPARAFSRRRFSDRCWP